MSKDNHSEMQLALKFSNATRDTLWVWEKYELSKIFRYLSFVKVKVCVDLTVLKRKVNRMLQITKVLLSVFYILLCIVRFTNIFFNNLN